MRTGNQIPVQIHIEFKHQLAVAPGTREPPVLEHMLGFRPQPHLVHTVVFASWLQHSVPRILKIHRTPQLLTTVQVSAPTMPLAFRTPYTYVELHTSSCIHRVPVGGALPSNGGWQQTQDAETIVAAINRYVRLQRRSSHHPDGHALAFEAHLRRLRPDWSPPPAGLMSAARRHEIESSLPASDDIHAALVTAGSADVGERGVPVGMHDLPKSWSIEDCTAQVLPSVFTNLHLPFPFMPEHPSASRIRQQLARRTSPSATPVHDRGDTLLFGRSLQELKDAQRRAISAAVCRSTDDRRWVSLEVPPRANSVIRILSRSPGHLHMCLPAAAHVGVMIISAVLGVVLCAATACCAVTLVDILQHSLARALKSSPVLSPGDLLFLQLVVDLVAGFMAARAVLLWRPVYLGVLHVRVSPEVYSVARVPGWIPGAWAVAASHWRAFQVAHGDIADVEGAQVRPRSISRATVLAFDRLMLGSQTECISTLKQYLRIRNT